MCNDLMILKDGDSIIKIPKVKCIVGRGKRSQLKTFLFDFECCDENVRDVIKEKLNERKE